MLGANALAALRFQGGVVSEIQAPIMDVETSGDTITYVLAPQEGKLQSVDFSADEAVAASDTNYVTFNIMNMGQSGIGNVQMLAAGSVNTSKLTGGKAVQSGSKRELTVSDEESRRVRAGDRLKIRVKATGTLANQLHNAIFLLRFVAA